MLYNRSESIGAGSPSNRTFDPMHSICAATSTSPITSRSAVTVAERRAFVVEAEPRFIARESDPDAHRWVFAYTITIRNTGDVAARLKNRHWVVTNANGARQDVRGRGVVGEEPHIEIGGAFRYTSAAVLETPVGTM